MAERHSHLGASSSARWFQCPGSVRLYKTIERKPTVYTATGHVAHSICEECLKTGKNPEDFLGTRVEPVDGVEFSVDVDEDMIEAVSLYVDEVRRIHAEVGGILRVEEEFSLPWIHPDLFGRNDSSIIVLGGDLYVFDYKHGRIYVDEKDNSQLKYYGLGAMGFGNPYEVVNVHLIIVQPNAFTGNKIRRETISAENLIKWGTKVLLEKALDADKPDAPLCEGPECRFCDAAGICPRRAESALELLRKEDSEVCLPSVEAMNPEQVGRLSAFFNSEEFEAWRKSLTATEVSMLLRGVDVPGRKIVEKKVLGNRKWKDESEAEKLFREKLGEEVFDTKLKTPPQMEKALGQTGMTPKERKELVEKLVFRPESTVSSVVNTDDCKYKTIAESQAESLKLLN